MSGLQPTLALYRASQTSAGFFAVDVEPWMGEGLCAQTDPELFFPPKGANTAAAKQVCARCPVQQRCLEYALERNERFGIWGGLTERDRRKLRTVRRCFCGARIHHTRQSDVCATHERRPAA